MPRLAAILFMLSSLCLANAQEAEFIYEVGFGGGMSWAYGDVNRSKVMYNPAFAGDLLFRYNANPRWSVVADLSTYGLKGDSRDFDNAFPQDAHLSFDNRLWQLAIRPEFSFWNYGWANDYREKKHLAPFITAGAGIGLASGDGDTGTVLCIPVGAGAKWKLSPRANAQVTCLFTRTFGDSADGIKDPYMVGSSGFANSDWFGSIVFSITFDFKERCVNCNKE